MHFFHSSFFHHPWAAHLGIIAVIAMAGVLLIALVTTVVVLAARDK